MQVSAHISVGLGMRARTDVDHICGPVHVTVGLVWVHVL